MEGSPESKREIPADLLEILGKPDGPPQLLQALRQKFSVLDVGQKYYEAFWPWEQCGRILLRAAQPLEALPIFSELYDYLLQFQDVSGSRSAWKATPLVWIAESHWRAGRPALAQRYLMLALCEDAITCDGKLPHMSGGVKLRLRQYWGMDEQEIQKYADQAYGHYQKDQNEGMYPEWVLQNLDEEWMTAVPSEAESLLYLPNLRYLKKLLETIGGGSGRQLEDLAGYVLSVMPGCRTSRRQSAYSTEYDLVCSLQGLPLDFRSELGRYFVCE